MRLIDADALIAEYCEDCEAYLRKVCDRDVCGTVLMLAEAPTIDAVPAEKYNELREAFVDFVCSGVNNPAPYCKNRCDECTNSYGWCTYLNCEGFNPDGERRSDE